MPKYYDSISDDLGGWAMAQSLFFTASAPLAGDHVNVSPKGLPSSTFRILSPNKAAYIDATGSGAETISHIYENGRVTIMFCSFGPSPRILRFFCKGKVVEFDQPEFKDLAGKLLEGRGRSLLDGARAVILLDVFKVQTACGFGVPLLTTTVKVTTAGLPSPSPSISASPSSSTTGGKSSSPSPSSSTSSTSSSTGGSTTMIPILADRETMGKYARKQISDNKMDEFRLEFNVKSLDGCAGLRAAIKQSGQNVWLTVAKARVKRVIKGQGEGILLGLLLGIILMTFLGLSLQSTTNADADMSASIWMSSGQVRIISECVFTFIFILYVTLHAF